MSNVKPSNINLSSVLIVAGVLIALPLIMAIIKGLSGVANLAAGIINAPGDLIRELNSQQDREIFKLAKIQTEELVNLYQYKIREERAENVVKFIRALPVKQYPDVFPANWQDEMIYRFKMAVNNKGKKKVNVF